VLAGMVHTDDAMITSVASIEAHGCALVRTHVKAAHGPLTHCTGSAGTRQAKNEEHGTVIEIRKIKYLNNIVEQDHRAVKRVTRPMLEFKSFEAAQCTLAGVELMHMLKKKQMVVEAGDEGLTAAEQFYVLAF
jgi:transposase-like protein